jgi:crotonobetaine/carnitine-CoA ligase
MTLNTLWEALYLVADEEPQLACIVVPKNPLRRYHPEGIEWTYGEVAVLVQNLIDKYSRKGWGRAHRIALLIDNRPEFMLHFLALNALGAWVVPINSEYQQDDLLSLIGHSEPDLIVTLSDQYEMICRVLGSLRGLKTSIAKFEQFEATLENPKRKFRLGQPTNDDEAVLLYTSGTTGIPKGCLIGNDYLFFAAQRYIQAGGLMKVRMREERLYNPLPLFYANSLVISNPAMIMSRNAMIIPDRFHPNSWWKEIVETRATIVHYLGIIPPLLLSRPVVSEEINHSVRFGVGAGIDLIQKDQFEARFSLPLIEVWGMSEVGITTATQFRDEVSGRRTIGRPLDGVEMKIVDELGNTMSDCSPGELVLRRVGHKPRNGLFRCYYKDEEGTLAAWQGGWFHTGDLVQREIDGSYTFIDRKKHIVRRSGQNIPAVEVEACLMTHPSVIQVAVIAAPDELRQEEVLACVITNENVENNKLLAAELVSFTLERLAYFKAPGWVLFVDSLPTTPTQKLQKVKIFEIGEDPRLRDGIFDLRQMKNEASRFARKKL